MIPTRIGPADASTGAVNVLAALLEARTGQQIAANRAWRIDSALRPLLAAQGADTIEALVSQLLASDGTDLGDRIVDALLNQETSFFRDAGIVEAAASAIAEIAGERGGGRIRIWSAGCSTGQEPLSLAMHFAEACEAAPGTALMPEIVATDVSDAALARGRAGRYSQFEIQRGLPVRRMMRWFDSNGGDWIAKAELVRMVSFRRQNIVADLPPMGPFDAVFCRNLLFYLVPSLRAKVLDGIADVLRPNGLLILGAGETVIGQTDRFRPSKRFRGLYETVTTPRSTSAAAR